SYPHQLSGGQRQRIMIAMALVLDPVLLIADEPTTALDVTTQAEILKLIAELQTGQGTGVLFITHDFGVVAEIAHKVAVLRRGETLGIVGESGSGKSTVARCIARLIDPTEGKVYLGDTEIATISASRLRPHRRKVQIVFQDPYRSMNPRITIGESIIEGPMN